MKFMIGVDCEGPACVIGEPGKTLTSSKDYEFACLQATREADAAARALFDAGAETVVVWDNHGSSPNLKFEMLDRRCLIATGRGFPHRWPDLERGCDGVLVVGYHSRDNIADGAMAHTFSSTTYQYIKINGREVSESIIDAAVSGEFDVPMIFASGDQQCVDQTREYIPNMEAVVTKWSKGYNKAISKHPLGVLDEIYESVRKAVEIRREIQPLKWSAPIEIEKRYKRLEAAEAAANSNSQWERVEPYVLKRTVQNILEVY